MNALQKESRVSKSVFRNGFMLGVIALSLLSSGCIDEQKNQARRAEASMMVRNIAAALKMYETDYGKLPPLDGKVLPNGRKLLCFGDSSTKVSAGPNSLLMDILRATPRGANADHKLNPKRQKYIEAAKAKDAANPRSGFADGPEFPAALQGCFLDPWGHQYCIVLTADDSGTIDLSAIYSDLAGPEKVVRQGVVAFSLGKDGVPGGKGYEGKLHKPGSRDASDDIVSWE